MELGHFQVGYIEIKKFMNGKRALNKEKKKWDTVHDRSVLTVSTNIKLFEKYLNVCL